jgi:hypothetical protein
MAEMLLINPRKRARRAPAKRRMTRARRRNPITSTMPIARKRNPVRALKRRVMRRRRNPAMLAGMTGYMASIRDALMGGVGAVAFDIVHGQIKRFLPAALQVTPGKIGAGDAVRAIITVFVGQALNGVTRGFSKKAAMASLTVQAHDLLKGFVPAALPLGYASPAMIAQGTNRVGPIRSGMNAYTPPGQTPLLSAYTSGSQLLNGARRREGASTYR